MVYIFRMFSIGIGEGASTSLVRGTARAGRGQAEIVTGKDRLQAKVFYACPNVHLNLDFPFILLTILLFFSGAVAI